MEPKMRYQLKIWNGSELAETRIYVKGGALDAGDKLFIKSGKNILGHDSWDANLKGDFSSWSMKVHGRGSSGYQIGLHIADEALAERGWSKLSFLEILAKLRNGEEPKEPVNAPAPIAKRELTDEESEQEADFDAFTALANRTPKMPGESIDNYSTRINRMRLGVA